MPNYCMNTLLVTGQAEDVEQFKEAVKGKNEATALSLEKILPTPNMEYKTVTFDNGSEMQVPVNDDWYYWRIENWGTKWDVDASIFMETKGLVQYRFDSAWSPPVNAIIYCSTRWPTLSFTLEYDEPGMDFWGIEEIVKGEATEIVSGPSKWAAENAEDEDEEEGWADAIFEPDINALEQAEFEASQE